MESMSASCYTSRGVFCNTWDIGRFWVEYLAVPFCLSVISTDLSNIMMVPVSV